MLSLVARSLTVILAILIFAVDHSARAESKIVSVCDLSRQYLKVRDKRISVRGVFYYGLRQDCVQECVSGIWPSFINLELGDETAWANVAKTQREVEAEAKRSGKRFEIWVTVTGRLSTRSALWKKGSLCDWQRNGPGFGHFSSFPAQIEVERFSNIVVKENPKSSYDYANMYYGPM